LALAPISERPSAIQLMQLAHRNCPEATLENHHV